MIEDEERSSRDSSAEGGGSNKRMVDTWISFYNLSIGGGESNKKMIDARRFSRDFSTGGAGGSNKYIEDVDS